MRILFQGDSITDCGRDRGNPGSLGDGYAGFVAKSLPSDWTFSNRGVSGDRVYDLESRWYEDCLALKPDLVTIMIGINDTWRRYDANVPSPVAEFEAALGRISKQVVDTGAKLILIEPFLLPIPEDRTKWREDLDPRIQAVRRVALNHASALVPLDGIFAAAACQHSLADLAGDGVHPSLLGHQLIADQVSKAILEVA